MLVRSLSDSFMTQHWPSQLDQLLVIWCCFVLYFWSFCAMVVKQQKVKIGHASLWCWCSIHSFFGSRKPLISAIKRASLHPVWVFSMLALLPKISHTAHETGWGWYVLGRGRGREWVCGTGLFLCVQYGHNVGCREIFLEMTRAVQGEKTATTTNWSMQQETFSQSDKGSRERKVAPTWLHWEKLCPVCVCVCGGGESVVSSCW
jgi:hypothetical protein